MEHPVSAGIQSVRRLRDNDNLDFLYDQVEENLSRLRRQLKREYSITEEQAMIEQLAKEYQAFSKIVRKLQRDIQTLDEEFDTGSLSRHLSLVETSLRNLQKALLLCKDMQRANEDIERGRHRVARLNKELSLAPLSILSQLEKQVEGQLDFCDRVADALDSLDEKSIDISLLEDRYTLWVQELESLQDAFEERLG